MPNPRTSSVKHAPARRSTATRPSTAGRSSTRMQARTNPRPASSTKRVGANSTNARLRADARNAQVVRNNAIRATANGHKVKLTPGQRQSMARLQSVQRSATKGFAIGGVATFLTLGSPLIGMAAGGLAGAKIGTKNTYGHKGSGRQMRKAMKQYRKANRAVKRNVRTLRDSNGRFAGSARI